MKMRDFVFVIIVSFLTSLTACAEQEETGTVNVYYYSWDETSRYNFDPAELRKRASASFTSGDRDIVDQWVALVTAGDFQNEVRVETMNGRLLVEFVSIDSSRHVYFADYFHVCDMEVHRCHQLTDKWREDVIGLIAKMEK